MQGTGKTPAISAGVVVIRDDPKKGPCVLMLKIYSKYDLPKGHLEPEHLTSTIDPILLCAADELFQESDYSLKPVGAPLSETVPEAALLTMERTLCKNVDKKSGVVRKYVHLYAAEAICPDAKIKPNPENGIREHDAVVWVPFDKVPASPIHPYLMTGVIWAMEVYNRLKSRS